MLRLTLSLSRRDTAHFVLVGDQPYGNDGQTVADSMTKTSHSPRETCTGAQRLPPTNDRGITNRFFTLAQQFFCFVERLKYKNNNNHPRPAPTEGEREQKS